MTGRRKTVRTPRAEAALYLEKAKQFAAEARAAIKASRNDAAVLNAVHAAISSADAVSVALASVRSADSDHQRAADLLAEVGSGASGIKDKVRMVRTLLSKKNAVEYESRQATAKEATESVKRAERIVTWADEILSAASI